MKAQVYTRYGPPRTLHLEEVPTPKPLKTEVLVKVHATAINDYDWSMVRGKPYLYRLLFGLLRPKFPIPGMEMSGTVIAKGVHVKNLNIGDQVYGDTSGHNFGSFAEYICVDEDALCLKPPQMTFEQAAAIPHAALLALQGLEKGKIQQGQKILINGGGGGVGTYGLQIAKQYGAEVTGVDTGEKLAMMQKLGYDHIIDYQQEDFTKNGGKYDLILDCKTTRGPSAYLNALKSGGQYVTVGGTLPRLLQMFLTKRWFSRFTDKKLDILALKPNKNLQEINKLFVAGKLKCIIDGPFLLDEIPKALQYFGEGKHSGKVVISVVKD